MRHQHEVKAGQLCAKIDPRPYQVIIDQNKSDLAEAEARFAKDKADLAKAKNRQEFVEAHHHLKRLLGATNTVVLLFSSWTMVMAVHSARTNNKKKLRFFLFLTILCACAFLGVKYFEYSADFREGLFPAKWYNHYGDNIPGSRGYATFFSFYFMMTGLHGIHILVGIILLSWLYVKAGKDAYSSSYYTPVDMVGLYWHIVDMIWIYLFPLYYLIS